MIMKAKINLNCENYTDFCFDKKIVRSIIKQLFEMPEVIEKSCLAGIDCKTLAIDFVFCDDKFIHEINKTYRKKDKPTDVITFALFCDDENSIVTDEINLGEIIVSVETAQKQADAANHSLKNEIYYLISHGILHLLGFDHLSEQEYNFMVDVQNKVTKEL